VAFSQRLAAQAEPDARRGVILAPPVSGATPGPRNCRGDCGSGIWARVLSIAIGNRLASVALALPLVDGAATGLLDGVPERVDRTHAHAILMGAFLVLLLAQSLLAATDRLQHRRALGIAACGEYFQSASPARSGHRPAKTPLTVGFRGGRPATAVPARQAATRPSTAAAPRARGARGSSQ